MIRRLLERIADYFTDSEWLRERRKQELEARRKTQHITRSLRLEPPFEDDMFPLAQQRTKGGPKP